MTHTRFLVTALLLGGLAWVGPGRAGAATIRTVDGATVNGAIVSLEGNVLTVADASGAAERHAIKLDDVLEVTDLGAGRTPASAPAASTPMPPRRPTMRSVKPATGGAAEAPAPPTPPAAAPVRPASQPAATQQAAGAASQPAAPQSWQIELAGGGRLRGTIEAWSDQQVRLRPALLDSTLVTIPLPHVRAAWSGAKDRVAESQAMHARRGRDEAAADVAYVLSDDAVRAVAGVALGINGDALRFRHDGQDRRINLARLVGVALAAQDEPPEAAAFHQSLHLGADESLPGLWTTADAQQLGLSTLWGEALNVPIAKVSRVTFRNGRLVYLSDLAPVAVEQVPYFDRVIPFRTDESLTGGPLRIEGGPTTRGIAVHSRCALTYDLGGRFDAFRARVGFQQPEGRPGRANVRVIGDGKSLFEKLDARGDQPPIDVSVEVKGVSRLTLEVDFGPEEDVGDRVVWGDAKLQRANVATVETGAPK